jgi:hypothetical protein
MPDVRNLLSLNASLAIPTRVLLFEDSGVKPLSGSRQLSPAGTGLTGGAHRSDRCWSVDSRFGVPLCSRVGRLCVGS